MAKEKDPDLIVTYGDITIVNPMDLPEACRLTGFSKGHLSNLCTLEKIKNIKKGKWLMVCPISAAAYKGGAIGLPGHKKLMVRRLAWEQKQKEKGLPINP